MGTLCYVEDCTEGQGFSLKQELCSPLDAPRRQRVKEMDLGKGQHAVLLFGTEALIPTPWECVEPHTI